MPADYDRENFNVRDEKDKVSSSYFQAQLPTLPPTAAPAVTPGARSLDSYTFIQNQDGTPPPSQSWLNKPSLLVPVKQSLSLINDFDAPRSHTINHPVPVYSMSMTFPAWRATTITATA